MKKSIYLSSGNGAPRKIFFFNSISEIADELANRNITIGKDVIFDDCAIGNSSTIGNCVIIGNGSVIGDRNYLEAGCIIGDNVIIGSNCLIIEDVIINDNAVIGDNSYISGFD